MSCYRRMASLAELRDGTAQPSVVILDLMETGRDVERGQVLARAATNPVTRRFAEEQAEARAERYAISLDMALDLIEEVRAHRKPAWVAHALESRFVDGMEWADVAASCGRGITAAWDECHAALEWLDRRHGVPV